MSMGDEGFYFKNLKEYFVPAEYSLLKSWASILEGEKTSTVLVYLCLQVYISRDSENENYGKTWVSIKRISDMVAKSEPTVIECIKILEKYNFIRVSKRGNMRTNIYEILPLPVFKETGEIEKIEENNKIEETEKIEETKIISGKVRKRPLSKEIEDGISENSKLPLPSGLSIFGKGLESRNEENLKSLESKSNWNCNDLIKYWGIYYYKKYGTSSGIATTKERSLFKKLLDEYLLEDVKKAIVYAVNSWKDFEYVNGYPTISAFYGFRRTIFPESKLGRGKNIKNKSLQYREGKKEGGIGQW